MIHCGYSLLMHFVVLARELNDYWTPLGVPLVILCMGLWYAQCGWFTDRSCFSSTCLQVIDLYLAFTDRRQSLRSAFDTGHCAGCEVILLSIVTYYRLHLSCCWYPMLVSYCWKPFVSWTRLFDSHWIWDCQVAKRLEDLCCEVRLFRFRCYFRFCSLAV